MPWHWRACGIFQKVQAGATGAEGGGKGLPREGTANARPQSQGVFACARARPCSVPLASVQAPCSWQRVAGVLAAKPLLLPLSPAVCCSGGWVGLPPFAACAPNGSLCPSNATRLRLSGWSCPAAFTDAVASRTSSPQYIRTSTIRQAPFGYAKQLQAGLGLDTGGTFSPLVRLAGPNHALQQACLPAHRLPLRSSLCFYNMAAGKRGVRVHVRRARVQSVCAAAGMRRRLQLRVQHVQPQAGP